MKNMQETDLPKLAAPTQRAFASAGIKNLADFTTFTEAEINELHGIGNNALNSLKAALKEKGIWFKTNP